MGQRDAIWTLMAAVNWGFPSRIRTVNTLEADFNPTEKGKRRTQRIRAEG